MKLHHLELRAFGPFGGHEHIDFDTLGAHGLFLMHGPTGSGKTSVLDAICFALFASVPGGRTGQAERLVSDHATAGARPSVRLEFTIAGRRLRVTRTPAHLAQKKRGSGTTRRQPSVLLEEHRAGAWHPLSNRADETAALLDDVIGMGLNQFTQVVLLPQGEFAAFLRAKADDRATLLQKLFDISRFSDLEAWLALSRRTCAEAVHANDLAIQTAVVRAEESLVDHAEVIERWRTSDVVDLARQIADTEKGIQLQLTEAMAHADLTAAEADAAGAAHERALVVSQLQRQAATARKILDDWQAQRVEHEELVRLLKRHQRALRVVPLQRAADRSAFRLKARQTALDEIDTKLRSAHTIDLDPEVLAPVVHQTALALARAAQAFEDQRALGARVPRGETQLAAVQRRNDALAAQSASCGTRIATLTETIDAARRVIAESSLCEQLRELLDERVAAEQHHDQMKSARDRLAREQADAMTRFAQIESSVLHLRARRLDGMAAELAGELIPDQPCPVCGSGEHPRPATTVAAVTQEVVDEAEQAAATARTTLDRSSQRLAAADAEARAAHNQRLHLDNRWRDLTGDLLELADVDAVRDRIEHSLHSLHQARITVRDAQDELERTQAHHATLTTQLQAAHEEQTRAEAALSVLRAQIVDLEAAAVAGLEAHAHACPCSPEEDDVTVVRQRHDRLHTLLTEREHEHRAISILQSECDGAADALNRQLEDEGFTDRDDAACAVLPPAQAQEIQEQVARATTLVDGAQGVLNQPEVAEAAALEPVDLEGVAQLRRDAQSAQRRARTRLDEVNRAARSLQRLHQDVVAHLRDAQDEREKLPTLHRMADLASGGGDNALRMRLSAYVLAARLEEVTELANQQLSVMSAGRYQLEHTDALARGGARSGLSLHIRDSWTGTSRDTATLSGGETFMVSLALALGLGQAVLHDTGGRPLQTLLVDEGFGTLDDESLELVMHVLDELRSGGRTVGIVSHVAELRTRVPAQIQVLKTEQGSSVRIHLAA